MSVPSPQVKIGRERVDFGQGFYLTNLVNQAKAWAITIAERKGKNATPTVSTYSLDYEAIKSKRYRIKIFNTYDLEWLEYVINCRKCGGMQHQYDLVEGGVANDNVIDTVEDYENGIITADQALGQLKYKEINHQICILNQDIVDQHLMFISSKIVEEEE